MTDAKAQERSAAGQGVVAWLVDLLLIGAFVALILRPLVFSHQTLRADQFLSDLIPLTQPSLTYTGRELARGHLPLWNPYWFAGYPHLAMPSAGVFYPTTVLFGLVSFAAAVKTVVLLHCYLAGAFSYLLGRSTFGRRVPALYLAFVSIAGDLVFPVLRPSHVWSLQTLSWFPLAVYFALRLCRGRRWGSALGLALTITAMIFAGDPQYCAFALYFLAAFVAAFLAIEVLSRRLAPREAVLRAILCLGGVVLGIALAAVQLIPSRELFAESVRARGVAYEQVSLLAPRVEIARSWLIDNDRWWTMATARTTLALAVAGVLFARSAIAYAAVLAALPCLLYAFMPGWFYASIVQWVPVYNGVRGAFRMSTMAAWAVAYLGAFGVAAWTSRAPRDPSRRAGIAFVTLGVLVVMSILPALLGDSLPAGRAVACAVGVAGIVMAIAAGGRPAAWILGCIVIIGASAAELLWKADAANISGDPAQYRVNPKFAQFSASRATMDRLGIAYNPLTLPQGPALGLLTRDRLLEGSHGLILARYARFFDEVGGLGLAPRDARGRLLDTRSFPVGWVTPRMLPLMDLFNVRYLLRVDQPGAFAQLEYWQARRFRAIEDGDFAVYENTAALPPVYPIHEVIVCRTDDEAIALLREGRVDIQKQVTVTGAFDGAGLRAPTAAERVAIQEYSPERITVQAELSAPAVVVFSEMFYPGWKAYVDGEAREVLCIDTAFRGVRAEAGTHRIELRYEPASLRTGAAISAASLVATLVIGSGVMLRRRRTRRGGGISAA